MSKTIVVIGIVGKKTVRKTAAQLRRFDDDGYATKTKNVGLEAYYVMDGDKAEALTKNCLFFSNVDPKSGQLMYALSALSPVAVHRSGGTNFGYRESNEFNDICQAIMSATGAKRILHFQASDDSGTYYTYRGAEHLVCRNYGMWYEKTLGWGARWERQEGPERRPR